MKKLQWVRKFNLNIYYPMLAIASVTFIILYNISVSTLDRGSKLDAICMNRSNSSFILSERIIMEPEVQSRDIHMLILINSNSHNAQGKERRQAIRQTWGSKAKSHCQHCLLVFLLGKSSSQQDVANLGEANHYRDIMIVNLKDSYNDLTNKLLNCLVWVNKIRPTYILKTDDDVYIDIPKVLLYMQGQHYRRFYGGIIYKNGDVPRNPSHRHYVSQHMFVSDYFPPFCKGSMYIISGNLLPELLTLAQQIPPFYVDDAYIGVLMHCASVKPVSISGFLTTKYLPYYMSTIGSCSLSGYFGLGDGLSSSQIELVHRTLVEIDMNCYICPLNTCFHVSKVTTAAIVFLLLICILILLYKRPCLCRLLKIRPKTND